MIVLGTFGKFWVEELLKLLVGVGADIAVGEDVVTRSPSPKVCPSVRWSRT